MLSLKGMKIFIVIESCASIRFDGDGVSPNQLPGRRRNYGNLVTPAPDSSADKRLVDP